MTNLVSLQFIYSLRPGQYWLTLVVGGSSHRGLTSIFLSSARPRLSLDITVPIGREQMPAISLHVKPSTTARINTSRCSVDNASSADKTSTAVNCVGLTCMGITLGGSCPSSGTSTGLA